MSPVLVAEGHPTGERSLAALGAERASVIDSSPLLPGRQVWAHMVPHGLPDFIEGGSVPSYGARYPLDLVPGGPGALQRATSGVPRARQAGVTGMQLLQFEGVNRGNDFVLDWMDQADPSWRDLDPTNDFAIAPCLLVSSPEGAVRLITEYSAVAASRPSAARVRGRLVVFVYAPRSLSVEQWAEVRRSLARARIGVFLIGDLQAESSQHGNRLAGHLVAPYLSVFDASWVFDDGTPAIWSDVQTMLAAARQPFAGGVMPGYDRETSPRGGFVDAEGTARFRREWELTLAAGATWTTMVTWNDAVEHTDIKASSDWNTTRQDITAFYAARFRRLPPPRQRAELYLTTPAQVRLGEPIRAEGLVLNGSGSAVQVSTQLVDAQRRPFGPVATRTVGPGEVAAATTGPVDALADLPAGRFLRATSWTTDHAGRVLQRVESAPVLVYDRLARPTPMLRRLYYSVPAARALPGTVQVALTAPPTPGSAPQAVVQAPAGTDVRFIELLQNTRSAGRGYDLTTFGVAVPMKPVVVTGGQFVTADPHGFYVGRVIDENERVGYSDPVFVG